MKNNVSSLMAQMVKNPLFVLLSGLASIISLVMAAIAVQFIAWAMLSIGLLTLFLVVWLVMLNTKILGRLDVMSLHVFDTTVELERDDPDDEYTGSADVLIILQATLSPESLDAHPVATIQIEHPSQLKFTPYYKATLEQDYVRINGCRLRVPLSSSGLVFLSLRSLTVDPNQEREFLRSTRKISITAECASLRFQDRKEITVDIAFSD